MNVAIIHEHTHPLDEGMLRDMVATTLEREGIETGEVSVLLCSDSAIAALHETYRGTPVPTDVLAFPQAPRPPCSASVPEPPAGPFSGRRVPLLGDVVVSVDTAARQAAAYGWSVEEELALLVLHGVLHLIGYDDQGETDRRAMQAAEERHFQALFGRAVKRELPA